LICGMRRVVAFGRHTNLRPGISFAHLLPVLGASFGIIVVYRSMADGRFDSSDGLIVDGPGALFRGRRVEALQCLPRWSKIGIEAQRLVKRGLSPGLASQS
jgi:hypothetical protein